MRLTLPLIRSLMITKRKYKLINAGGNVMDISIYLDAVALLIIGVIALFHYEPRRSKVHRYQMFNLCLVLTAGTLISDMVSLITIGDVSGYPLWVNILVNSIYFICINSCLSIVAAYVFYLLFEYMPEQKCYKIASKLILSMWIVLTLLVFVNLKTGWYFYFENNAYCRGPLNKLGFIVMGVEVCMLCACYFRNRKVVTPYALNLVKAIPPVVMMLTVLQFLFPTIVLTGIIAALVNLILFICFQSNRVGRDALTELPNRNYFWSDLHRYEEKSKNAHMILIHIRDMKKVNKHFGMKNGDKFLFNVARYLENLDRKYQVYRYGNTYFTMLGEFENAQKADELAQKIIDRFEKPWELKGKQWIQHIQVVHMEAEPENVDEKLKVEQLRYMLDLDKGHDENTKIYFDDEKKTAFERKNYVLNEVKKAIENKSFQLYFQPIYACKEQKFTTAEVLLRLFAEDGSFISPGEFIPISEEYNLSDDITWIVLQKSMKFIAKYPDLPIDTISVNMSVQQMSEEYLKDKVAIAQKNFGPLLYKLRIEITEGQISRSPKVVRDVMQNITDQGVFFYLDDFGVGYSNLSRMFEMPFEVIKIDRSLMMIMENNKTSYEIIKNVVDTFHTAGFKVVAEGLETEHQVALAKEIGVDRIQGFYYARPMCEEDFVKFIEEHN